MSQTDDLSFLSEIFPTLERELILTVYNENQEKNIDQIISRLQEIVQQSVQHHEYEEFKYMAQNQDKASGDENSQMYSYPPQDLNKLGQQNFEQMLQNEHSLNLPQDGFTQMAPPEQQVPIVCPPSIDVSENLYKDILQSLHEQHKSGQEFMNILKTLRTIIENICKEPENEKFKKLRAQNPKIKDLTKYEQVQVIFEMLGFQKIAFNEQGKEEDYYVLVNEYIDLREFKLFLSVINDFLDLQQQATTQQYQDNGGLFQQSDMNNFGQDNTIQSQLQKAYLERQQRHQTQPQLYQKAPVSYQNQLKSYRQNQKHRYVNKNQGRIVTMNDLQKKIEEETKYRNMGSAAGKGDSERMGVRALELTNKFRKEQGLPPLSWNQALHDIAIVHSKNMAEGRVAFGHDGFNERMRKVPFFVRSFSENVAYNYNYGDPAEVAVIGWINSPGHRKNMLSNSSMCGIAVYNHNGRYYFTQLFALS